MYAKTINYTDYNGVNRTETLYFNLSKAEMAEMQLTTKGGYAEKIEGLVSSDNTAELFRTFKDLILMSYGEKSEDGRRFVKSKELSEAFAQTEAYSELFMELATNDEEGKKFISGIMPSGVQAELAARNSVI